MQEAFTTASHPGPAADQSQGRKTHAKRGAEGGPGMAQGDRDVHSQLGSHQDSQTSLTSSLGFLSKPLHCVLVLRVPTCPTLQGLREP
jgi:hypothetical protein